MQRVTNIWEAGSFHTSQAIDRVVLDADERHRRRIVLIGENGTKFLLDLDHAVALKEGDGLVLEDGSIVTVAGKPEPLIEIEAKSPLDFVRLAWHLGNRHTQVEIVGDRMRIRRDHVLESMVAGLGGKLTAIEAPFAPEASAHAQGEHSQHSDHHAHGE
jgi:urease accessory protein